MDTAPTSRTDRMRQALSALMPLGLEITNDSARHHGHAGDNGSGESHFSITLVSAVFMGQTRVARERMVHALLADEFASGLHAVSLQLRTPEEAAKQS